jgi:putative transposase
MIDREHDLSITRQAEVLKISRGSVYYLPRPVSVADLAIMQRLDRLHLEYPFAGSRMLRGLLALQGCKIGRRHVKTLMRRMGIEALYRRPRTTKPEPGHKIHPYLLRGIEITRPNQVWAMDITYIPMARGFVYLAVVLDWATRRVLSWRLSITTEAAFCVETLEDALARHGRPDIFNTDQGSQFTGSAFTGLLASNGIAISMDGKGAWRDNVFVERLWRSVKYEEVYLRAYESVSEARTSISTMAADRTKALTTPHQIKPTSTSRQSAWRPNPGRGSTYRRGETVQTTGTSSRVKPWPDWMAIRLTVRHAPILSHVACG